MRRHAVVLILALTFPVLVSAQGGRGEGRAVILEQAPTDRAIAIPSEKLAQYLKDMDAKKQQTLRMIEGGKFNVNIRRITGAETALIHPNTTDLWVVLEGSGTLTTGGLVESGKFVGGESHPIKVGDVVYLPAGLPHGVSAVNGNIRHIKAPANEFHDITADTWVVLKGAGTTITGFDRTPEGGRVDGTGVSTPAKVGDVVFIPGHFTHGFSALSAPDVFWLNIRWDINYAK